MHVGEYHGNWRGTPHFCAPELNTLKEKEGMGVLKHGGKIDVYAIGVTMAEMAPRLNKRNLWERKFSELLEGMKRADPERRLSVMQVLNKLKTLDVDGPDQFGCLPMSKRALELLDNLFTTCGSPPRKKVSPSKRKARSSPRRARESPSKCKTTSNPAPTSPKPTSNRSRSSRRRARESPRQHRTQHPHHRSQPRTDLVQPENEQEHHQVRSQAENDNGHHQS